MQDVSISTIADYIDITGHEPFDSDQCPKCPNCGLELIMLPDEDGLKFPACPKGHDLDESEVI